MNTEDHDIKSFFAEMRKKDRQQPIPEFEKILPKKKSLIIRYIIPVSIAASLIVGFGIWANISKNIPQEETIVITIESEETHTESLLTDNMSIFSWESQTDALINDFND